MRILCFILSVFIITVASNVSDAQLAPWEAVSQMQKGINLGNTLEPPYEAGWNNPKAEEYYFDLYQEAGFDVVRIPVRWDNHTLTSFPYTIGSGWLNRVEQLVDWGLSRGLYIVINSHHDNWIKENYNDADTRERFDSIWSQIATRFMDKSEKLIFEVLNEPHGLTKLQNDDMHQRIISIIRKTNPTRIIIFQGHNWGGSSELLQAAIPDDEYVMGSFHSYDPYLFGLEGQGTWGSVYDINELQDKFISVKQWSDENSIPVFLGEFGALKSCDYNSRMKHYRYYVQFSREYGFSACAWDDGGDFRIMERQQKYWNEIKDILIYCSPLSPENFNLEVYQDSIIKLTWKNNAADNDSIFIERRKSTETTYQKIASTDADLTVFHDVKPDTNFTYHYRVIAHYNDSTDIYSHPQRIFFPGYKIRERELFLDEPTSIPGIVEAENFDKGGEGIGYHDSDKKNDGGAYRPEEAVDIFNSDGNYLIFNALPGEWYEYTVDVKHERTYDVVANVASTFVGGKFLLEVGNVVSDTLEAVASGSWVNTTSVSTSMKLKAGEQIMRLSILSTPAFNIDNIVFELQSNSPQIATEKNKLVAFQPDNSSLIVTNSNNCIIEKINLYNITGSVVKLVQNNESRVELAIEGLPRGVYIVKASIGKKHFTKKIIIH